MDPTEQNATQFLATYREALDLANASGQRSYVYRGPRGFYVLSERQAYRPGERLMAAIGPTEPGATAAAMDRLAAELAAPSAKIVRDGEILHDPERWDGQS